MRTRSEVIIPRASTTSTSIAPGDMLRNGAVYIGLPLRALALASAGEQGSVKVMAMLEPIESGVTLTSAVFGLIDGRDRLVAQWTANERELAVSPILTAGAVAPGSYRLRVAAIDSAGRRGTAEYDFGRAIVRGEPAVDQRPGSRNIARQSLRTQTCLRHRPGRRGLSRGLRDATESGLGERASGNCASPDGRSLTSGTPRVTAAAADRRMVTGAIPIAPLAPGDYVVRAIVSVDGRPVGRVTRTLRKVAGM